MHSTSTDFFKLPKQEFRNLFTTGFLMAFVVMVVACVVLYLLKEKLAAWYGYPAMFCWLIPVITFLTFTNEQLLALVRNMNQPMVYFKANTAKIMLELGISVMLVVAFAWRWEGRVAGIFIAYISLGVYACWYFYSHGYLFGKIVKRIVKAELLYAVPIICMQVSIFCMGASDKFFLAAYTTDNNQTVGIYSIATIFASVIIVLATALIQYIFPKVYELLSAASPDYTAIRKLFRLYLTVIIGGSLVVAAFTPIAYRLFINEKYHAALDYLYIIFLGYLVWAIVYFFYSFLLYFKEKRRILLLSLCSIAIALTANAFFISRWGAYGAAIATLITYILVLGITLFFTRKYWLKFIDQQ